MPGLLPSPQGKSTAAGEGATATAQHAQQHPSAQQRLQQDQAGPSGGSQHGNQRQQPQASQSQRHRSTQQHEDEAWLSDSRDDEGQPPQAGHKQQQQQSPDPLYDDQADERDMAWAITARQGHASDAILSCPGCFATLCIDCQQHHLYSTQFRAMFVMNCEARAAEAFSVASSGDGSRGSGGRKRRHGAAVPQQELQGQQGPGEVCYPVHCRTCGTRVGVMDADEVYHFTSVLASTA